MADTKRKRPAEVLTEAEVRSLLGACSRRAPTGIRDRALLTVLYRGGLRIEEALDLKPADVDPDRGTIRVLHGKGDHDCTVAVDDGAIAGYPALARRARQARRERPPQAVLHAQGGPLSANHVRQMVKRRAARAEITKRVHPHALRHTHAAELVAEGVPVNVIQKQLGHVSLATTDIYLRHIAPADVIAMGSNREWSP
jgi:site-specific recombinase XerD